MNMEEFDIGFAKIIIHGESFAEVIVKEGVEFDEAMVDTYHAFLRTHLTAPFRLLINKVNSYSYSFKAQQTIGSIPEIDCMAILGYTPMTMFSIRALIQVPREHQWNVEVFTDRMEALAWLGEDRSLVSAAQ